MYVHCSRLQFQAIRCACADHAGHSNSHCSNSDSLDLQWHIPERLIWLLSQQQSISLGLFSPLLLEEL